MALKKSQKSLKAWTKQKWRTKSGKKSSETGERYFLKKLSRLYHLKSMRLLLVRNVKTQRKASSTANNLRRLLRKPVDTGKSHE